MDHHILHHVLSIERKLDKILTTQAEESAQIAANAQTTQQILTGVQTLATLIPQYISDVAAYQAKTASGATFSQSELDADNASLTAQGQALNEALTSLSTIAPAVSAADSTENPPAAASSGSSVAGSSSSSATTEETSSSTSGVTAASTSAETPANTTA